MELLERRYIDWKRTGKKLLSLRNHNPHLRRYTCWLLQFGKGECGGDCETCEFEMDSRISRAELAEVFRTSESVIFNWENGVTPVSLEDLLYYCRLCRVELADLLVYE